MVRKVPNKVENVRVNDTIGILLLICKPAVVVLRWIMPKDCNVAVVYVGTGMSWTVLPVVHLCQWYGIMEYEINSLYD